MGQGAAAGPASARGGFGRSHPATALPTNRAAFASKQEQPPRPGVGSRVTSRTAPGKPNPSAASTAPSAAAPRSPIAPHQRALVVRREAPAGAAREKSARTERGAVPGRRRRGARRRGPTGARRRGAASPAARGRCRCRRCAGQASADDPAGRESALHLRRSPTGCSRGTTNRSRNRPREVMFRMRRRQVGQVGRPDGGRAGSTGAGERPLDKPGPRLLVDLDVLVVVSS